MFIVEDCKLPDHDETFAVISQQLIPRLPPPGPFLSLAFETLQELGVGDDFGGGLWAWRHRAATSDGPTRELLDSQASEWAEKRDFLPHLITTNRLHLLVGPTIVLPDDASADTRQLWAEHQNDGNALNAIWKQWMRARARPRSKNPDRTGVLPPARVLGRNAWACMRATMMHDIYGSNDDTVARAIHRSGYRTDTASKPSYRGLADVFAWGAAQWANIGAGPWAVYPNGVLPHDSEWWSAPEVTTSLGHSIHGLLCTLDGKEKQSTEGRLLLMHLCPRHEEPVAGPVVIPDNANAPRVAKAGRYRVRCAGASFRQLDGSSAMAVKRAVIEVDEREAQRLWDLDAIADMNDARWA